MLPVFAFAQDVNDADSLINLVNNLLKRILPIIISIAVIYFIWNVFSYAISGDEEKKEKAKNNMIWGIVALFVMVSVWGLVGILTGTFNLSDAMPKLPGLPAR